ncbi:MAG: GAF domain-containing protein [Roseinatronobacter sp.]
MPMNDPDAVFATLHDAARAACGARLFTVTVLDRAAGVARRAYTSHPSDYPTSGTKQMQPSDWSAQVLEQGRSFVANSTAEFAPYFADHPLINALGCEAAMNIPVPDETGQVIATVNILDAAGHFTEARISALETLVAQHRAALLDAVARVPMEGHP